MIGVAALLKAGVIAPVVVELSRPDALRFALAAWSPVWSGPMLQLLLGAWLLGALAFFFGWHTRWTGFGLTLVLACVLVGDEQLYSNHLYLLLTVVGLMTLAEGQWVARPITLLRIQVTIVYGFAAITKLTLPYLSGAVLNVYLAQGGLLTLPDGFRTAPVMASLALSSILVESLLAVGLWSSEWRGWTILLGVTFHIVIILFLDTPLDLIVFALLMFALYLLHVAEPETLRQTDRTAQRS